MLPLVSIIVPLYNAEKYLETCVDSIRQQTLADIEIILVNDGSTDGSSIICDGVAASDERVSVIHKLNAGVSAARNDGIAAARGQYIGFVDADDTIELDMYSSLFDEARRSDSDIVMCDAVTVYPDGKREIDTIAVLPTSQILTHEEIQHSQLLQMAGSACRCIYRTELIRKRNIQFPAGHKFSEDRIFNILSMGYANKISYRKTALYHRRIHAESAVHRFHSDYFEHVCKAHFSSLEAINQAWESNEELKMIYGSHFISGAYAAINNYFYKTSDYSLQKKINAVRTICRDSALLDVLAKSNRKDIRSICVKNNWVLLLSIIAIMLNIKHRR